MLNNMIKVGFAILAFTFLMPLIFAVAYFLSFATVLVFPAALFFYVYMAYDLDHAELASIEMLDSYRSATNLIYFEDLVLDKYLAEKEQRFQHYREIDLSMTG